MNIVSTEMSRRPQHAKPGLLPLSCEGGRNLIGLKRTNKFNLIKVLKWCLLQKVIKQKSRLVFYKKKIKY